MKAQEASPRKPMCFVALVEQAGLKRLCYLYSFYMVYERWLPIVGTMPYNKYIYIYIYMCVCFLLFVVSWCSHFCCGLIADSHRNHLQVQCMHNLSVHQMNACRRCEHSRLEAANMPSNAVSNHIPNTLSSIPLQSHDSSIMH